MADPTSEEIKAATRNAVRDILLGDEGQVLFTRVAEQSATRAITDFMLKIGMDTTTPMAIIALQSDMYHLRWWNKTVASSATRIILVVAALLATSGWGFLVGGVKNWVASEIPISTPAAPPAHTH